MINIPRARTGLVRLNLLLTALAVLALLPGMLLVSPTPATAARPPHEAGHPTDNVSVTHPHGMHPSADAFTSFPGFSRYDIPASGYAEGFSDGAASTYWVNGDSGLDANSGSQASPWKTIQHALDTVAPGDTIRVVGISNTPTEYYDETLVITRDVTITGDGPDTTWLEPDVNSAAASVISLSSPGLNVTLNGMYVLGYYNSTDEGGCISASDDNLTLQSMFFENDNDVTDYGGAICVDNCTLTMNGCITFGSNAWYGSGLYAHESSVYMADCYFLMCGGLNSELGGAIYLDVSTLNAARCSFYDNYAYRYGGGIFISAFDGDCTASLSNCTLSYNYTDFGGGAGIYAESEVGSASLTLTGCTFYINEAGGDGGGLQQYGSKSATTISNCIFDNYATGIGDNVDIESGTAVSNYSLYSDTPAFTLGPNDITNTYSLCYWMADNGGTTPTCAIDSTSPARNAGSNAGLATDQRGVARGPAYDIGAYQWVGPTYASVLGNDANSGLSALAPKKHVYAAVNLAGPGSAAYVASGTYLEENHFDAFWLQNVNIDIYKPLTLTGTDGAASTIIDDSLPKVSDNETIIGVFDATQIWPDGAVSISGLTLANAGGDDCFGGGMSIIEQYGVTTVRDCIMRDNHADFGGGGVYIQDSRDVALLGCKIRNNSASLFGGGGILSYYNDNVTISNCEVTGNSGTGDTYGGGIFVDECLSFRLTDSIINGNNSDKDGGGIYGLSLYDTSISGCTVDGNSSDGSGGGIYLSYTDGANVVLIEACTLSNNRAGIDGGGLFNGDDPAAGISSMRLTNCTIYGNSLPAGGSGGGVYNAGHADLLNCTIYLNDAGLCGAGGGYFEAGPHTGIFKNTILAANTAGTGNPDDIAAGPVYIFNSNGHNICTTDATVFFNQPTDNNTTDPGLGPLQDNGGPTFTCAIDATSPAFNTAADGPSTDQRGYLRPACGGYDVGAYELQPVTPTVSAIIPGSGLNTGIVNITDLAGTNFVSGATIRLLKSGQPDIGGISVVFISSTRLTCVFDLTGAAVGTWNVVVTNPYGASGILPNGFTVTAPPPPPNPNIGTGGQTPHGGSGGSIPTSTPTIALGNLQIVSAGLSDSIVAPGAPVTVTADIINRGMAGGSKKITLYVNGQEEATQGTTVNKGGSTTLTFSLSRSEPGDYIVYVDDTRAGSFKVEAFRSSDIILWLSMACVLTALALGVIMLRRR